MGDFRKLLVWQAAHRLARASLPVGAAAISVPANIAEGCGRNTDPELRQFAKVARGSAAELEYLLVLAADSGFLEHSAAATRIAECQSIQKMLHALIDRLRPRPGSSPPSANSS